jgi:hypothetical protein
MILQYLALVEVFATKGADVGSLSQVNEKMSQNMGAAIEQFVTKVALKVFFQMKSNVTP